ncbi:MAG TPA: ribosome biogenesis factor YjgA [Pseudomonadales bacterium]|nr:ribosome biogenesis factor YjgA [Pseudomonadales bacterium]
MSEPLDPQDPLDEEDLPPSKSQIKREMHALRDLGQRITELSKGQRAALPLSEAMRRALVEFDRIRSREARRRHLSFIGKVMRTEDIDAITETLDRSDASSAVATRELHALEAWRDRLLADDEAMAAFITAYPNSDRPRLRALVRNARREAERDGDRRHFRELFRILRDETARAGGVETP